MEFAPMPPTLARLLICPYFLCYISILFECHEGNCHIDSAVVEGSMSTPSVSYKRHRFPRELIAYAV